MGKAPVSAIKKLIVIKIKTRADSYSDQYTRLFMVRMFLVTSLITGLSWLKDQLNCLVPKSHGISPKYVSQACWINGVYVYRDVPVGNQSYYYGIPDDFSYDGMNKYGGLCATQTVGGRRVDSCSAIEKTFFLQYQWFPGAVAAIGIIYYLPYLLFKIVNSDMQGLKDFLKSENVDYGKVVNRYFDYKNNPPKRLRARVLMNVVIKMLYIIANVIGFVIVDRSFAGWFSAYGRRYASWAGLGNEAAHQYFGSHKAVKPGHELLPGFGICEVFEEASDIKTTVLNTHKFICEMSQHVLYQYMLVVLWYTMVFGIVVSIVGFVFHIFDHFFNWLCFDRHRGTMARDVYKKLTIRERQYLEYVRRKNMAAYGELIREIHDQKGYQSSRPPSTAYEMKPPSDSSKLL